MTQKSDQDISATHLSLPEDFTSGEAVMFPGSFNPFTIGHADIVEQALRIFPKVVIAIGFNIQKPDAAESAALRVHEIREIYRHEPRVAVCAYSGLTAIFAQNHNMRAMIRGLRSAADFDYEKTLADANAEISTVATLFIPCKPSLAHISSSMVRELQAHGYDTSRFLPKHNLASQ